MRRKVLAAFVENGIAVCVFRKYGKRRKGSGSKGEGGRDMSVGSTFIRE